MPFEIPQDLDPALYPVSFLIGEWAGVGLGQYPTIEDFRFGQEVSFSYTPGKTFLDYESRSWLIDEDGDVLMRTRQDGNFEAWYEMGDRVIKRDGPWGGLNAYLMDGAGREIAGPYRDIALMGTGADGEPYFVFSDFDVAWEPEDPDDIGEPEAVPGTRRGGLMDRDGDIAIEMGRFISLNFAARGYLIAETGDEIGLVDMRGEWLVKFDKQIP